MHDPHTAHLRAVRGADDPDVSYVLAPDPFVGEIPEAVLSTPLPGAGFDLESVGHLREHLIWMRLQGREERTLFSRRRSLVRLAVFLGRDPAAATRGDLHAWQIHLLATSRYQVAHQTALISPYYTWLHDLGIRPDNPSRLLLRPKQRRGLPRPIGEEALTDALLHAKPRIVPWLLLAGWSGLRAKEIAGLRVDDFTVDPAGGQVWARVLGKGSLVRDVPVPAFAWPTIAAALADRGPAWRRERGFGPVTPHHVSDSCNKLLHRRGHPDTLHSLRHRAATAAYRATNDLRLVQDFLGHQHSASTAIYTFVAPDRVAAAVAELPHPTLPTPPDGRHLHSINPTASGGTA